MNYKITELTENLTEPLSTQHINLVCDSGAFNGTYLLGCMQYLKELEKKNFIKINKLSGSSIGSLLSFFYIIDKLDDYQIHYKEIRNGFKNDFCLKSFKNSLTIFFSNLDNDIYKKLNNKLYINYYNIDTNKEIIISTYTSNDDIMQAILSSSFIPYVMNGELCYNGNIDGINPYIFKERTVDDDKILFIRLTSYGKLKKMLNIRGEHNHSERMLEGILDTHRFFKGDKSTLCSWINNWGFLDYLIFRSRQIFWLIMVLCCYILKKIIPYIPDFITNNKIVNTLRDFIYKIYQDMFIIFYNS
tara:strand:- start:580 stop:1485 length:906 start_codon:yes stop_codon:yes gene_type:complete